MWFLCFHCSFAMYSFFQIAWKNTFCEFQKVYFLIYNIWEFLQNWCISKDIFLIHNFNLQKLKHNGIYWRVSIGLIFNSQFQFAQFEG